MQWTGLPGIPLFPPVKKGGGFRQLERMEGRKVKGGKLTRITGVGVRLRIALCDLQIVLFAYCVEGGFAAAEELAGGAVANGGKGRRQ